MLERNLQAGARPSYQIQDLKDGIRYASAQLGTEVWLSPRWMEWIFGSDKFVSAEVQGKDGIEKAWTVLSNADDWQVANRADEE